MMSITSIYSPLDPLKSEIRLLEIVTQDCDTVCCKLSHVSLRKDPVFSALSYVWGDATAVEDITVDGHIVAVTRNLAAALRHVRALWTKHFPDRDASTFRLWADAICINQADIVERSSQVQQMGSIYHSAEAVLAWLGQENDNVGVPIDFPLAVDFFTELLVVACELSEHDEEFFKLEWMKRRPELWADDGSGLPYVRNRMWRAALGFVELPYWQRAWIFQEAVLAKKLLLCTAGISFDFDYLKLAMVTLNKLERRINSGSLEQPDFVSSSVWVTLGSLTRSSFDFTNQILRAQVRLASEDPTYNNLYERWYSTLLGCRLQATDPRDHIYALLGISKINLVPCYDSRVPVRRLYRDYVAAWLSDFYSAPSVDSLRDVFPLHSELHFLTYAGLGSFNNPLGLPTWAPNFPECSAQKQINDPPSFRNCNDVDHLFPSPSAPPAIIGNYTLRCEGVYIDVIIHLIKKPFDASDADGSDSLRQITHFTNGFLSRNRRYISGMHPLQALLRVLIGDGKETIDEHFMGEAYALLYAMVGLSNQEPGFRGSELDMLWKPPDAFHKIAQVVFSEYRGPRQKRKKPSMDYFSRVLTRLNGYRLYETSRGYIGFTFENTLPGDVVCLLKGYWMPVVLRETGDRYLFVNPSFVAGLMNNEEVSEVIKAERRRIKSFFIR